MEINKLQYAFRFYNLEPEAYEEVKSTLSHLPYRERNGYYGDGRKTFIFVIEEGEDYSAVFKLIRTGRYSEQDYGIFAMFTSNQDQTGIHFPEHVLQFHKEVGGQIDISIIFSFRESESQ
jgi:hypothetical protein